MLKGRTSTCGLCTSAGHNARGCPLSWLFALRAESERKRVLEELTLAAERHWLYRAVLEARPFNTPARRAAKQLLEAAA